MHETSVELNYEETGKGTPIVFIHGFPLNHTTWLPVAELLKEKAHGILPDVRGLGQSPVTGTETTIAEMAGDVVRLMDRLEVEKAVIAGHSMGGYVSMEIVHNHPDRVSGLCLVATRSGADTPEKAAGRILNRTQVLQNGTSTFIRDMSIRLTDDLDLRQQLLTIMQKASPSGVAMALHALANRKDATPWLEALSIPIILVSGGRDTFSPPEVLYELSRRVKDGRYYSSPTGTHMVLMEEPGLVARALEETFLNQD